MIETAGFKTWGKLLPIIAEIKGATDSPEKDPRTTTSLSDTL